MNKKVIGLIALLSFFTLRLNAQCSGGTVNIIGSNNMVTAVAGDLSLNFEVETSSTSLSEYAYIITSNTGDILGRPASNEIMISGAPVGTCYVYGFSYTGTLDSTATTIGTLTATGCFEVSTDFVSVTRTLPTVDGGDVTTSDDESMVRACQGGDALMFDVMNSSIATSNYAYVITDNSNNILAFPSGNSLDLSGASVGVCYVYGFSYTGNLDSTATTISTLVSDDEFELSNNYISVYRDEVEGGNVNIIGGGTSISAVAGDESLNFEVESNATSTSNYAYIITSNAGDILGFPASNEIMISGAPVGTCYVYGFSYTGTLDSTATTIETLTATGCFEVSTDFVSVTRTLVNSIDNDFVQNAAIFPNPFNDEFTIDESNLSKIEIINMLGAIEMTITNEFQNIEASLLTSGMYLVRMTLNDGSLKTARINKN